MILKGIKFGLLLQLAVGPMCLMVFNTSLKYGVFNGLSLVLAITLVDALYILLACAGVATIINNMKVKRLARSVGGLVLIFFGIFTIGDTFHFQILPTLQLFKNESSGSFFIQGLILTLSNPLTIIFWSGMFTAQIIENTWNKRQLGLFAIGCVLATVLFLVPVSVLGTLVQSMLPESVIQLLNVMVGIVLIAFGVRLFRNMQG